MSTPIDLEQVHIVAYGLNEVIDEAFHLLQGIMAFGEKYPDKVILPLESDWYALAYSALLKSLVIETASLLDRAKYRKDSNCNFRELQEVLESNTDKHKYQKSIDQIENLLKEYDNLIPDVLRNKIVAHRDLEKLFANEEYGINLIEITRFLLEGHIIISDVLELSVGAKLANPDLDSIKRIYEKSLVLL